MNFDLFFCPRSRPLLPIALRWKIRRTGLSRLFSNRTRGVAVRHDHFLFAIRIGRSKVSTMTTAHTEIESEVLKWSPTERVSLAERLLESVEDFATEDLDRAWRTEVARRVGEVESGKESGILSRDVFAEARQKLNEARQVSSARPK